MDDLLVVTRVFHPDLKIANMKSHADLLKGSSCLILLVFRSLMFRCLKKQAMCCREHVMLLMSLLRNSLVPNKDVAMKFPFHRLGSARMLVLYGMTSGGEGLAETSISLMFIKLGTSSRGIRGLNTGREKEKQVTFSTGGKERSVTNFIRPYLHQFSIDSHGLNGYGKPLKRPFDWYQSCLEAISNGRDIRQINW